MANRIDIRNGAHSIKNNMVEISRFLETTKFKGKLSVPLKPTRITNSKRETS